MFTDFFWGRSAVLLMVYFLQFRILNLFVLGYISHGGEIRVILPGELTGGFVSDYEAMLGCKERTLCSSLAVLG